MRGSGLLVRDCRGLEEALTVHYVVFRQDRHPHARRGGGHRDATEIDRTLLHRRAVERDLRVQPRRGIKTADEKAVTVPRAEQLSLGHGRGFPPSSEAATWAGPCYAVLDVAPSAGFARRRSVQPHVDRFPCNLLTSASAVAAFSAVGAAPP